VPVHRAVVGGCDGSPRHFRVGCKSTGELGPIVVLVKRVFLNGLESVGHNWSSAVEDSGGVEKVINIVRRGCENFAMGEGMAMRWAGRVGRCEADEGRIDSGLMT
jgi:hypothetical protein